MTRLGRTARRLTLLQRLLIVEGFVFALVLASVFVAATWFADGLEQSIRDNRLRTTLVLEGRIDQTLSDGVTTLRSISPAADGGDALAGQVAAQSSLFTRGVFFVDPDGRITRSFTLDSDLDGLELGPSLTTADRGVGGALAWGFRPRPSEQPIVALAVPIEGPSGRPAGYVVGFVDSQASVLAEAVREAKRIGETGHADIVDSHGVSMISSEIEHPLRRADHPAFYVESLANGPGTAVAVVPYEEEGAHNRGDHLMGFARLESFPWGVALGGDSDDSFAPISRLWTSVLALAAGVGVVAVAVTVIGTSYLVRPIRALGSAAQRVAAGELDQPLTSSTGGEIGDLADSIESMRSSLHDWGAELDNRVQARTAALERSTSQLAASAAVAQAASSTLDLEALTEVAATEIERHLDVDGVLISISRRGKPETIRASTGVPRSIVDVAHGCAQCFAGGPAADGAWRALPAGADAPPCVRIGEYTHAYTVPIRLYDERLGTLCLLRREGQSAETRQRELDPAIAALLASQVGVGVENASLYADATWREAQRQQLLAKVLTAQEQERQRIAHELHDETGQAFIALMLGLDAVVASGATDPERTLAQLARLRSLSAESLGNLRNMVLALRPSALDDLGLVAAVERYADHVVRDAGIDVQVQSSIGDDRLAPEVETAIFRIVQEALNNVARHSGADQVDVRFDREHEAIRVRVEDNGRGFVTSSSDDPLVGVGIEGMTERASLIGGRLSVESKPTRGTRVELVVPLGDRISEPSSL